MTDIIMINEMCRACLRDPNNLKSIYAFYDKTVKIIDMINFILGSNLNEVDAPNSLCERCREQLLISYNFKKQYIESEKIINDLHSNHKLIIEDSDSHWYTVDSAESNFIDDNSIDVLPYHEENSTNEIIEDGYTQQSYTDSINNEFDDFIQLKSEHETSNEAGIESEESHTKTTIVESTLSKCLRCKLIFPDRHAYQLHHRQNHRMSVLCPLCGKLVSSHSLDKHIATHSKSKDHLCTECGKRFTLSENLKKHLRIHSGDKRYICELCGEKFIHWNSKRSHIRTVHTGEKKYECSICGKKFAQSSNMFRHVRSHTGELPHECTYCGKKFISSPELRNHIVTHTKERNHKCMECGKAFGTKKSMRTHLKIHTGEKNYVCPVCGKAFIQAHVLRTHMKTHPNCPIPAPGAILSQKALNKLANKNVKSEIQESANSI